MDSYPFVIFVILFVRIACSCSVFFFFLFFVCVFCVFLFVFVFVLVEGATPMACGSTLARDQTHTTVQPAPQLRQCHILNLLQHRDTSTFIPFILLFLWFQCLCLGLFPPHFPVIEESYIWPEENPTWAEEHWFPGKATKLFFSNEPNLSW